MNVKAANRWQSFGRLTGIRDEESDAKIREAERYSNARAYGQYTGWESLGVWNSIWFLLPAEPGRRKRRWVAGEGVAADHRHPRKGGAPRGVRLTRHPAGSSHSYCQLPTLRPSRSSLAPDSGWFQPLSDCSSYVANVLFVMPRRNVSNVCVRGSGKRNLRRASKSTAISVFTGLRIRGSGDINVYTSVHGEASLFARSSGF